VSWRQGVSKVRTFLESMYGVSYDEERFRTEIRILARPPEGQAKGDNNTISLKEKKVNDHR
jgi:hypothetical protein